MIKIKYIIYDYIYYNDHFKIKKYKSKQYFNEDVKIGKALKTICNKYHKCEISDIFVENFANLFWRQYFKKINSNIGFYDLTTKNQYFSYKLSDYEKQFRISKKRIKIFIDPPRGGRVGYYHGVRYFFHTNENCSHHNPHIHIKYGSKEYSVNIDTLKFLPPYKGNNQKEIIEILKYNQKELKKYWRKVVVKGESIKFKMTIPF